MTSPKQTERTRGVAPVNTHSMQQAAARQAQLLKPPAALGMLESIAIRLAGLQSTPLPRVDRITICIFAADHGVAAENVSAFPQAITAQMLYHFTQGGAAIHVLAEALGAELDVVDLGTVDPQRTLPGVRHIRIGPGSANFTTQPAMTSAQFDLALEAGRDSVERALRNNAQLFIGGEMGIGNTTSATAVGCGLLELPPHRLAGPGSGLDASGITRKINVIERALALHRPHCRHASDYLRRLGGFEIVALAGAYIECARRGLPALVDGFICSIAALAAMRMEPGCEQWLLFSHVSAEPGHRLVLDALEAAPLIDLGMRLGEASGAAVAVPLLRLACTLHEKMATFAEAQAVVDTL